MNSKFIRWLQATLTVSVILLSTYCALWHKEFYPFAQYTMYSYKQKILDVNFFRFFCNKKNPLALTSNMIRPFDEARLKESLDESYNRQDKVQIIAKLNSLKKVVEKNHVPCEEVVLRVMTYNSPEKLLTEDGEVKEEFLSEALK